MIKVGDKYLRNLEEQVQYLTDYHDVNQGLVQWGIRVIGQVDTVEELNEIDTTNLEYGDAVAVGTLAPFFFYIWTRASIEGNPAYWFPFGEISSVGPVGPKGDVGPQGPQGVRGSIWTSVYDTLPNANNYNAHDQVLKTDSGSVYECIEDITGEGKAWMQVGNIRGPRGIQGIQGPLGIQGIQGPQGPKGDRGDVGGFINIRGILNNQSQLPLPSTLSNLTVAYLVGSTEPYDLYIQVGDTSETAIWTNTGPFNVATMVTVDGEYQNIWDADVKADKTELNNYIKKSDFNMENGTGDGAIKQKSGGKTTASGIGSVALNGGYSPAQAGQAETAGVQALGALSLAGGKDTTAHQIGSVALGNKTKAGMTQSEFIDKFGLSRDDWGDTYDESFALATATGLETEARGRNSFAANRGTKAIANDSTAFGVESNATGVNGSLACGFKTEAIGEASFAANNQTKTYGSYSSAFGTGGEVYGTAAFKTGQNNKANGAYSFTEGENNEATQWASYAGGISSKSLHQVSMVRGRGLESTAYYQTVVGEYNTRDTSPVCRFIVGVGSSDSDRKDGFKVLKDGRAKILTGPSESNDVVNKAYADTKLSKDTSVTTYNLAYVKASNGGQGTINVTKQVVADAIPQRQSDGNIYVPATPSESTDAASKEYVDSKIATLYQHNILLDGSSMSFGGCKCALSVISTSATAVTNWSGLTNILPSGTTPLSGYYYDTDTHRDYNIAVALSKTGTGVNITYAYGASRTFTSHTPGSETTPSVTDIVTTL